VDIRELRRANLLEVMGKWLDSHSTPQGRATERQFAQFLDINVEHFSQIKTGHREMGFTIARRIEGKLGLDHGWMDLRHDSLEPREYAVGKRFGQLTTINQRLLLEMLKAMESGHNPCEPDDQVINGE
jgi:hypothetical protein